jgi:hypothetical protein
MNADDNKPQWQEVLEARNNKPTPPDPYSMAVKGDKPLVEVVPGIMVSEHLIQAAVDATSTPGAVEDVERREAVKERELDEIREDISASRQVLQAMAERMRNPPDLAEKYVSFDAMPAPLQRVVKAYIDADAANKELDSAIAALKSG